MRKKIILFAAVEKDSNRAFMLFESGMVSWVKQNCPEFNVVEVSNTGTTSFRINAGTINTVCVMTEDFGGMDYHIIKEFPDTISLGEAYELIAPKKA